MRFFTHPVTCSTTVLFTTWILSTVANAGIIDPEKLKVVKDKVVSDTRYFIKMKSPKTAEKLCVLDDKIKSASEHIRDGIEKVISFSDFEGFSGNFSPETMERISKNPLVSAIVPDSLVRAMDIETQYGAPTHLVRLSQPGAVNFGDGDYYYDDDVQGEGVTAYVIDTGIMIDQPEFEERAFLGPNFSSDARNIDYVGHGTHVAGVIGSATYGVAKKIDIVSIKVLDRFGQGTLSSVIAGLEFAVNHRQSVGNPGVANLSLGAARSPVLDEAIEAAFESGLFIVSAAGNSNVDACKTSPAGSPHAYTVGAIDPRRDRIAGFSNWGQCVDIFASGVGIESLSNNERDLDERQVLTGTSMASPIVCGLVAFELEKGTPLDDIPSALSDISFKNAIPKSSIMLRPGSPNKIASSGLTDPDANAQSIVDAPEQANSTTD
ncbi:unnamed protein product [Ambrosiozyma monospora]|uniref:Unnamed protein product n=1 Tax=Ambrosiozyma monospora TaxID=43982 RepID=A0A9W7DM18_AMBMO|nr:unnamed protein product [Ambrosiozyma monospora]